MQIDNTRAIFSGIIENFSKYEEKILETFGSSQRTVFRANVDIETGFRAADQQVVSA